MQGYFWAIFLSIPIGFAIGLFPVFRGLFSNQVNALRYLPLTALTGLFIIWFGIEDQMKIAFLAFGIIVYLLPVVVQRVDEVNDVYLKTVFTLGATDWQTIRSVYIPSVMSKLIDDIRVLTAISWTYIIIAELLNRQGGGIGSLIYLKARQGQIEKVFGILIVIVLIGFIQDRIFVYLDKRLFPHKYLKQAQPGIVEIEYGIFTIFGIITLLIFQSILLPSMTSIMTNITLIVILASLAIIVMGELKLRKSVVEE
jgi:ABC-type nitrate/sulfonate/bicarbonate transport system permease component